MNSCGAVITGLGFVTSIGHSRETVAQSLRELRHGFSPWQPVPDLPLKVRLAGQLAGFDVSTTNPAEWTWPEDCDIVPAEVRGMAPHGVYALAAVRKALAEAAWTEAELHDPRTGLHAASGGSSRMMHHHLGKLEASGWQRAHPTCIVSSIAGTLNFHLAALLGIRGASCGFVSACSSGSHALGFALDALRLGRQDRMIVVAAEDLTLESALPFAAMGALSFSDDPALASRPFDRGRDGFVATGGAVAMIVESEASAARRGARPLARFSGWGQACDGYHAAAPHPEGRGIRDAMSHAMNDACISPENVDYINAHATSTPAGDRAETIAIRETFGSKLHPAVSSTKALTGHGLSLAGVMEAAFCVLAIDEGFIPGQAHLVEPDETSAALHLPRQTLFKAPHTVMNNSCGFGGSNVAHVFQAI